MPPIAKNGCAAVWAAWEIELQPDRRSPGFRRRLPDGSDTDVVDRQGPGSLNLLLGMGGEADDGVGAEQRPRFLDGAVVLAEVHPVGVAGAGKVGVVVDDEQGAVGVAEAAEGRGGALDLRPPQLLLAQLDDVDAAAQRRPQQRFGVLAAGSRVADEIEAGGAQALAAQRAVGLGGREAHPAIMTAPNRPPMGRNRPYAGRFRPIDRGARLVGRRGG